jgi:DNA-binding transcriptional regulator LsrR (DeoR family)
LEALDDLQQQNVVGDILGRFFNTEGFIGDVTPDDSLITRHTPNVNDKMYLGIPVDSLKKAKQIICICGGTLKIPGIRTAAVLKLFDCLITDSQTAAELAESLEK